ncbi:YkvA family protein [Humibacillus xanthopallidus]|uniref:YkvA family protein n=1 Tax=Humibacillus xanthopallidus TaxID=412689 RepID=UPI00384FC6E3
MKTASRLKLAATAASVVRASMRSGGPSVAERVSAVPRLVRATLDGTYAGTTVGRLGLVAAAVAYVASPIDLLPEAFLPVLGAADDAVVIGWAVKAFIEETDRFVAWELGQGLRRSQTMRGEATWSSPVGGAAGPGATAGHGAASGAPRPDRDSTGAAAPGAGDRGPEGKVVLPEGVRQAATDYVLETVRKRLER